MKQKLTNKQKAFINEYVIDKNATQAAIRAGYSKKTAGNIGDENLKKPQIKKKIDERLEDMARETGLSAKRVLKNMKNVAERCMQATPVLVYNKFTKEYDQVTEKIINKQTGEEEIVGVWSFDSGSAINALDKLGKHLGIYERDNEQKKTIINIQEATDEELYLYVNGND